MTVRAKGKVLLEHTLLAITAGRRYGLVGPNGKVSSCTPGFHAIYILLLLWKI